MRFKVGNLVEAEERVIGHGVNCRGYMGAGVAAAVREAFPPGYAEYREWCLEGLLAPGEVHWYRIPGLKWDKWLANVASQDLPGPNARLEWLVSGVTEVMQVMSAARIPAIALPRIGCGIGGLKWEDVEAALKELEVEYGVEVVIYDLPRG